ncbi:MAG: ABC transporter permease, partial [Gammaproteobacteria bacterium]
MTDMLYLSWRYVAYNRWKTLILVLAITLVIFLPAALNLLIERSASQLVARAEATPLLIGAKGSPLELALNALYFKGGTPPTLPYADINDVLNSQLALPVPLYVRFTSNDFPIVGTTPDYFDFRDLKLTDGRHAALLGEAVIGAEVANTLNLQVGDTIISAPESAFDLAGVYPLKMNIVGILQPAYSADDTAIFTDIKTTWVIEGLGHGHQ